VKNCYNRGISIKTSVKVEKNPTDFHKILQVYGNRTWVNWFHNKMIDITDDRRSRH
jgi:hypothetical protein